jgi:hypothetical protein
MLAYDGGRDTNNGLAAALGASTVQPITQPPFSSGGAVGDPRRGSLKSGPVST